MINKLINDMALRVCSQALTLRGGHCEDFAIVTI